jgi:hypothetical protein
VPRRSLSIALLGTTLLGACGHQSPKLQRPSWAPPIKARYEREYLLKDASAVTVEVSLNKEGPPLVLLPGAETSQTVYLRNSTSGGRRFTLRRLYGAVRLECQIDQPRKDEFECPREDLLTATTTASGTRALSFRQFMGKGRYPRDTPFGPPRGGFWWAWSKHYVLWRGSTEERRIGELKTTWYKDSADIRFKVSFDWKDVLLVRQSGAGTVILYDAEKPLPPIASVAGRWETTTLGQWGPSGDSVLVLEQKGRAVTGTFKWAGKWTENVSGHVLGNTAIMHLTGASAPSNRSPHPEVFFFALSPDGTEFAGEHAGYDWQGRRLTPAAPLAVPAAPDVAAAPDPSTEEPEPAEAP